MNTQLLISIGIIFAAFTFWVIIQESARRFARRHPEFGPAREEGGECGISCGCPNWKKCRDRGQRVEGRGERVEGRGIFAGAERDILADFQEPALKTGRGMNANDNKGN